MKNHEQSTAEALKARERCLARIDAARQQLVQAFIEATPCCGWADGDESPYHLLDKASDDVKALWHTVNDYRLPARLDSEPRNPVPVSNRTPKDLKRSTGREG